MSLLGGILAIFGALIMLLAVVGILRFDDPLMKLQAATKGATGGMGLILVGLLCSDLRLETACYVVATMGLIFIASPTVAHVIAKAHLDSGGLLSPTLTHSEYTDREGT
jgi:monovalent cation/proton antiporter MnhG/PhaG subunit